MILLSEIIMQFYINIMSLTAVERWQAIQWIQDGPNARLFVVFILSILCILIMSYAMVTFRHLKKILKAENQLFFENAEKTGLTQRERRILLNIAADEKLKYADMIFTSAKSFDRGATKITRAALAKEGSQASKQMNIELSLLREKLGFRKNSSSAGKSKTDFTVSTEKIPAGRAVYITSLGTGEFLDCRAIIKSNDNSGITLDTQTDFNINIGETISVRYFFGSSIWEFESTLLSIQGKILQISQSDKVRFVNRRRFLRVPVNSSAYIAEFPFAKKVAEAENNESKEITQKQIWGPPEFVSAKIVELAGPGLRLLAPLELKPSDRAIVVFCLDEKYPDDSIISERIRKNNFGLSKIIEDIAVVRHCQAVEDGFLIAAEMTTLTDSDMSEMIRITNAASIRNISNIKSISNAGDRKQYQAVLTGEGR